MCFFEFVFEIAKLVIKFLNNHKLFSIILTLFDITVLYIFNYHMNYLCNEYWHFFSFIKLFPFFKILDCEAILQPYTFTAIVQNMILHISYLYLPKIVNLSIKPILPTFKLLFTIYLLIHPGVPLALTIPLKLFGYFGLFLYSLMIVDIAWLPGEKIQEKLTSQKKEPLHQIYIMLLTFVMIQGMACIYLWINSTNYIFPLMIAIALPVVQYIITPHGSLITTMSIVLYISFVLSNIQGHFINYLLICSIIIYNGNKYSSYIQLSLLLAVHSQVINIKDSSSLEMQQISINILFRIQVSLILIIYIRSLFVSKRKYEID